MNGIKKINSESSNNLIKSKYKPTIIAEPPLKKMKYTNRKRMQQFAQPHYSYNNNKHNQNHIHTHFV